MTRNTLQAIKEAGVALGKEIGDSEAYHSTFDELESRLRELDPQFMQALDELYDKSGETRYYA